MGQYPNPNNARSVAEPQSCEDAHKEDYNKMQAIWNLDIKDIAYARKQVWCKKD